ncbi:MULTISPECIES: hypothetical protein [unclassified Nocardia]|uniref:hypothetical protein n=1 Tax=unclassified Nocardia TaxID=2637762 RepID=UPI00278C1727|nr:MULTISPECIES: hypothetical protein [unclassified Nocardia]
MTDTPEPEIVDERRFAAADYIDPGEGGTPYTEKFARFVHQVKHGHLPDIGEVPEIPPQVRAFAEELAVIHLPEWRNPAGRLLSAPTVTSMKQAVRVAGYLYERGYRWHPELEQVRWVPTPSGPPGAFDTGLHITPDEHGDWPVLDPEQFYDIADIKVERLNDGQWGASHPRGLAFKAATKSEAYAGLVGRLRAKIEEATS